MVNRIISIGETVWDIFPDREVLGGAPLNAACHLRNLGRDVSLISRVGDDRLGEAARHQIAALGVPTAGIQVDEHLPTGQVDIRLDEHNEPHFEIREPAAWDNIIYAETEPLTAGPPFCLLFGTLGQRGEVSRATIDSLRRRAELCFYDVNLRPPFTNRKLVEESMAASYMVKMNEEEFLKITAWYGFDGREREGAGRQLLQRFNIGVLVVTLGAGGGWLLSGTEFVEHSGFAVRVVDTVGAGDAFFAAFINGFMAGQPWVECLRSANRLGSEVAARPGATAFLD